MNYFLLLMIGSKYRYFALPIVTLDGRVTADGVVVGLGDIEEYDDDRHNGMLWIE